MCVVMRKPCGRPVGLAEPPRFRHRLGKDIARRDIAAFGDQLANEFSSHPAAATGDDRNPACEILHCRTSLGLLIGRQGKGGWPPRHQSRSPSLRALMGSLLLSLPVRIDAPIGTEQPIPEIVDYREIAISIPVVDKMELLLSPKPGKSSQP